MRKHNIEKNNANFILLIIIILVTSSAIKLTSYEIRPVHHDEAVCEFIAEEFQNGDYKYEPEYHTPLNFILLSTSIKLFGTNINGLRLLYVIFSIITLLVLSLLIKEFDRLQFLALVVMMAFSPILNYYSNYAYFESYFTLFYTLFIVAIIKLFHKNTKYLYILGLSSALMLSINEVTYVIIALSLISLMVTNKLRKIKSKNAKPKNTPKNKKELKKDLIKITISIIIFITLTLTFFSVLFKQNPIINIEKSLVYNIHKSYSTGQNKPPHYYITVLLLELPTLIIFLTVLISTIMKGKNKLFTIKIQNSKTLYFLVILSTLLLITLSIVPYKTPWNTIFLITPIIFTASFFFKENNEKNQKTKEKILLILAITLLLTTIRVNFFDYDNPQTNPLSYVQAQRTIKPIIRHIILKNPERGIVVSNEYWPIPWYLRNYKVEYYFKKPNFKIKYSDYDFMIFDTENIEDFKNSTKKQYQKFIVQDFEIRPGVTLYLVEHKP